MNPPIYDFVTRYLGSGASRLHMPGHKGAGALGCEGRDITEIAGADALYEANGIIAESEKNASLLFGSGATFYAAEGSSQCLRAMLYLAMVNRRDNRARPVALAARNAHKSLLYAAALCDFDVEWLWPERGTSSVCACPVTAAGLRRRLSELKTPPFCVLLTSPDYLGGTQDIEGLSSVCHAHHIPLLVDNAHGAYLKFLPESRHPLDLGADLCCDSAHKTLPALTGAAYLHVREGLGIDAGRVKSALALFGSSSPSWLILQSLDACNPYLETLSDRLAAFLPELAALKERLIRHGYVLTGDEPMKLTIKAREYGATGDALAAALMAKNIYPEFHDPDFLTLMPTPANVGDDLRKLEEALLTIPRREPLPQTAPPFHAPARALSIREAAFTSRETLPIERCEGRVLAESALSCPPCVPIAVCGEVMDADTIDRLRFYGIKACAVVR